ncbi:MAG: flagellar assembly protein FliW [Lachnospiraceae bacterium]|nr:flagellar assembly protein FliW [Lachnospiraceae bacterium]
MLMKTKFFGEVNIADDKVITLVNGLLGFEDLKKYVILYDSEKSTGDSISWFQSADEQTLALPVVNPLFIKKDYNPMVNDELLEPLGDPGEEGYFVLVTMRIPSDPKEVSCNLKAPIIINPKTLLGCQIIVENQDYPVRFNIYDSVQALKEKAGD